MQDKKSLTPEKQPVLPGKQVALPERPILLPEKQNIIPDKPPRTPPAGAVLDKRGILEWQVQLARHLAHKGDPGPFEIGDFLCTIDPLTGNIFKRAKRVIAAGKGYQWRTVGDPMPNGELCGTPIRGPKDSFGGMDGVHSPAESSDGGSPVAALRGGYDPMWF